MQQTLARNHSTNSSRKQSDLSLIRLRKLSPTGENARTTWTFFFTCRKIQNDTVPRSTESTIFNAITKCCWAPSIDRHWRDSLCLAAFPCFGLKEFNPTLEHNYWTYQDQLTAYICFHVQTEFVTIELNIPELYSISNILKSIFDKKLSRTSMDSKAIWRHAALIQCLA